MDNLVKYITMLGDNAMILGHRLSELCGHGPSLETDIALTNMSLDLYGQVRSLFGYAAQLQGDDVTEDSMAFLRYERQYLNCLLVEQPNVDFGHIITRQFFFDVYHKLLLEQLVNSKDETIAAIANKSIKEVKYHLRFSTSWMQRLGDGTAESNAKMQNAVNLLYPYCHELVKENEIEKEMRDAGIGADLNTIKNEYFNQIHQVLNLATLSVPENSFAYKGGKEGIHTEHMGFILSDLQFMQRAYPNMTW